MGDRFYSTAPTTTADTELPAAAALSDAAANPTTTMIGANLLVWNGTTWDRAPATTANGLDVDVTRLPALVAGTANIGDVDVLTIAAGDNNIGNVDVVTLPALVAGTANIGDVDVLTIAAGDNNIGNVDIVTLPALVTGSAKIGVVDLDSDATVGSAVPTVIQFVGGTDGTNARALKTDTSGELQVDVLTMPSITTVSAGDVANDAADSGNPVKIGGKAIVNGALTEYVSAASDRTDARFDTFGRLVVRPQDSWAIQNTAAANTAATVTQASAGPGLKNVCTAITVTFSGNASSAVAVGTVFTLRDGAAGTILWSGTIWITATAGDSDSIPIAPIWIEGSAATAMILAAEAAGGVNTLQTVSMSGTITR